VGKKKIVVDYLKKLGITVPPTYYGLKSSLDWYISMENFSPIL